MTPGSASAAPLADHACPGAGPSVVGGTGLLAQADGDPRPGQGDRRPGGRACSRRGPPRRDRSAPRGAGGVRAGGLRSDGVAHDREGSPRPRVWRAKGEHAPDHGANADRPLFIDDDATLITARSKKAQAAPSFKRGLGFYPIWTFADYSGEAPARRWRCRVGQRWVEHCSGSQTPRL
jgi:hypothetical protein